MKKKETPKMLVPSQAKMEKSVNLLGQQFNSLTQGATAGIVETLKIEYEGTIAPIAHLATIYVPYPHRIVIRPHDVRTIKEIRTVVNKANLGVVVTSDGDTLAVNIPMMTMERRDAMVKHVQKLTEEARVSVRNIRREVKKEIDKLPKSEAERMKKELQDLTDRYMEIIDGMVASKCRKVME